LLLIVFTFLTGARDRAIGSMKLKTTSMWCESAVSLPCLLLVMVSRMWACACPVRSAPGVLPYCPTRSGASG